MTTTPAPEVSPAPTAFAPPRTLSILSLVAAIASVPLGHIVILPIAAIVLGFLARSREPWARTMSTWGIAIGFVVLFWWVAVGFFALAFWVPLSILHFWH
ncbi:MAG: hypothetical protein QOH69_2314 [Actinomycetota bacterium]|jgi:hypothetical protein|nr:hypothetical protein [Actinomycetota bacterium]MDQ1552644.1 hypothetical protein [Actinomycetota bacterium]